MVLLKITKKALEVYFHNDVKRSVTRRCHIIAIFVEKIRGTLFEYSLQVLPRQINSCSEINGKKF